MLVKKKAGKMFSRTDSYTVLIQNNSLQGLVNLGHLKFVLLCYRIWY